MADDPLPAYVRTVADALGLADWEIVTTWGDLPDETLARVHASHARRAANVIVGETYLSESPTTQRETIIHELLHLHAAPVDEVVSGILPTHLGGAAFNVFETAFELAMERAIDAVAVAISNLGSIPLPPDGE